MRSAQVTVGTTPTLLAETDNINRLIYLHGLSNKTVYLGGSDVTTSNGFILEKDDGYLSLTIPIGETVYGVVATGTEVVTVLLPND
jgi:hypothetical protein